MYSYQIKCCFYTQNGCMNKKISFYKIYRYNINISHNKTTGLRNSFNNLNVNYMYIKPWCGPMTSKVFKAEILTHFHLLIINVISINFIKFTTYESIDLEI
jgi:hypothetical protein